MQLLMPKIHPRSLTSNDQVVYAQLDNRPFGTELVARVIDKLLSSSQALAHAHRDNCGLGLFYIAPGSEAAGWTKLEGFVMAEVYDGMGPGPVAVHCDSREDVLDWLAGESDQSMALYGSSFNNQTITRLRLEWYLEPDYSPGWNSYIFYKNQRHEALKELRST